jgi:carboxymethylenebutenolidase
VNKAVGDIAAAAGFLRSLPSVGADGSVGIVGFCLGGGLALLALARTTMFRAGIVYHHSLFPDNRELKGIACKLQCHYGTNDRSTPKEEVDSFTKALDHHGVSYEIHWYEGMGHSFAQVPPDADLPSARRSAADLSHARCLEFLNRELGTGRPLSVVETQLTTHNGNPLAE